MSLNPVLSDDMPPQVIGYAANIIPTVPGTYTFRFFGNVNGTSVNESFQCGPTTFECVNSLSNIQFPEKTPSGRQVQLSLRDMQSQVTQLQDSLRFAYVIGVIGIIFGIAGLVVAVIAVKRKKVP